MSVASSAVPSLPGVPDAFPALRRRAVTTLQVNLGYRCNQACTHCHVEAGPSRTEMMSDRVVDAIVDRLAGDAVASIDLTGGAPELHPRFRDLVTAARRRNVEVIDRCNLTILEEPGQEDLAEFLAREGVVVIASLPCYLKENVDRQRGKGVFDRSLDGLRRLNALGYGCADSDLELNLVFNPQGATLAPPQAELERDYKAHLEEEYGIVFDRLLTLTNMPIKRFAAMLRREGMFDRYLALLRAHHDDANLDAVMCRSLVSIDWQGYLYDCDFNQMLDIPLAGAARRNIVDVDLAALAHSDIAVGPHCFGCTAGQGSSCGGALSG